MTTRATRRRVRLALVILLGFGPVLTSCGGAAPTDEDARRSEPPAASTSASAGGRVEGDGDDQEATGSFADVADPATQEIPTQGLRELDAVEDVRVGEGSIIRTSVEQVAVSFLVGGREIALVIQSDQVLALGGSREEMDYWLENTTMSSVRAPREVAPVVVDGVEMLRAQGKGGLGWIDHFVRGNGDLTATFDFIFPYDMSAREREQYAAQVMSTVRLAPELL